jgi:arabinose-5-phosphate isomerase
MTASPQTVSPDTLAAEALKLMEDRRITVLFVIEHGRPAGILHIHDILRAGVV